MSMPLRPQVRPRYPFVPAHLLASRFCRASLITLLLFAAVAAAVAQQPAALSVAVGDSSVVIQNVASGSVVLFSCEHDSYRGRTLVSRAATVLTDDDRDGTIEFTPKGPIPLRSVWVAVDLATGTQAAGAQTLFPLLVTGIQASRFKRDAEGAIAQMEQDSVGLLVLLVRPGKGAWLTTVRDGAARDEDHVANGHLTLSFAAARTVHGNDNAPKNLKTGDVVVTINPNRLDVSVTTVTK